MCIFFIYRRLYYLSDRELQKTIVQWYKIINYQSFLNLLILKRSKRNMKKTWLSIGLNVWSMNLKCPYTRRYNIFLSNLWRSLNCPTRVKISGKKRNTDVRSFVCSFGSGLSRAVNLHLFRSESHRATKSESYNRSL